MYENSSSSIGLKCAWHGRSKQVSNQIHFKKSKFQVEEEESIILSGPYGDDVAFFKETNDQILIGLSDGVSGNRHHGFDPYEFAHTLILCCLKENDRINNSSSMRGLIHRAIRSVEKRQVFGSATLCLLSIEKASSCLRSINIGDSGFMLIRQNRLVFRSNPQYHRGSSPFQLSFFPKAEIFPSNLTRLYHDKPSDGQYAENQLEIGDLLLVASDGLFDNLYEDSIVQILNDHVDDQFSVESLQNVCRILVQSACHADIKRDDILVLLFHVVPCTPLSMSEINGSGKSTSCSSSDSSLSCLSVDHEGEEEEEESLDLFIFKD